MAKHHPKNERIKHRYLAFLEEAKRLSPQSTTMALASIGEFEKTTNHRDFAAFHVEQARKFKRALNEAISLKSGKRLSKATIRSRLVAVKAFFLWLADQPGYRSRIAYSDCEYFNPSANDGRVADARIERPAPSLAQIRRVLSLMPISTAIEQRDRALVAFTLLSGARDDAIASLNISHVDLDRRRVLQDARIVRTKNRKTIVSTFFPVGDDIEQIVREWITHLTTKLNYGLGDPLFPSTQVAVNDAGAFAAVGLTRQHWRNADSIRRVFRRAFEAAGLPYFHPHSFRHTLTAFGARLCVTPEEIKAWSQNLGHERVSTTLTNYGLVAAARQAEIITDFSDRALGGPPARAPTEEEIARVLDHLRRQAAPSSHRQS